MDGYLPKQEPRVLPSEKGLWSCPPKEDFVFPPKGSAIPNLEWVFPFIRLGCLGIRFRGRETPGAFPGPRCHLYKLHLFLAETGLERMTLRVKIGGPALSHQQDHGDRVTFPYRFSVH